MEKIIQNYAHDYRMMSMTELELSKLLTHFLKEIQTYQPKVRHKLSCDNCSYTGEVSLYNGLVNPMLYSCLNCGEFIIGNDQSEETKSFIGGLLGN